MFILSIDIGMINMGIVYLEVSEDYTIQQVLFIKKINLTLLESDTNETADRVKQLTVDHQDMFNNAKFVDGGIDTWNNHNGKKVKTKSYYLQLITGDEISIECYDQPKSSTIIDNLNIAIDSFEFAKWLHNK